MRQAESSGRRASRRPLTHDTNRRRSISAAPASATTRRSVTSPVAVEASRLAAIARANEYQTYDAAYVETILLQERRRRELPSPTPLRPQREEWIEEIDFEEPDPAAYDRFCKDDLEEE